MIVCEWFALCANETDMGAAHPILGVVPICQRCADRFDMTPEYHLEPRL